MQVTYDPNLDDDNPSPLQVWIKRIVLILIGVSVLVAIGYGISKLMSGGAPQKKQITTIKLLPDTPPPPPPKEPPKEQPKEAPKEAPKEVQKPAETPPAETIKMEGAAGDGPSPFAAGQVTNDYAGGDVKIGSDGGAKFNWYAGLVKSQIENALEKDKKITEGQYKLVVSVWLKPNGDIEKLDVVQSDAKSETEQAIKEALRNMPAMREAPPEGMPQPIKLRISARKLG